MEAFWGPDAQMFRPERWLDEKDMAEGAMREIKSYKHILTFSDGPRTCLGKGFALTEMKVCSRLAFLLPSVLCRFFPFSPLCSICSLSRLVLLSRPGRIVRLDQKLHLRVARRTGYGDRIDLWIPAEAEDEGR